MILRKRQKGAFEGPYAIRPGFFKPGLIVEFDKSLRSMLSYPKMTQAIIAIAKNFINLLYPLHCATCNRTLDALNKLGVCDFCLSQIKPHPEPCCQKTGLYFKRAYSACLYDGVLKELIHLFKYKKKLALGGALSGLMEDFIRDNHEIMYDLDIITFVPLHSRRLRQRGFNQSNMLASSLSKEFDISIRDILEKPISTRHQNELSRGQRLTNLKNVFKIRDGTSVKGLRILLIDDVMTTGATLSECAKALLSNGAKEVRCLALARGL